ncbi:MAG: cupin domain-containing protein [Nitrospira sp.]|nr:cupin domain-containing protein [Nitrospira sp.]
MIKKTLAECREFLAGDHTMLRELLHPAKEDLALRYSLAHGRLGAGRRAKLHVLSSSEVYYFIAGKGRLTVDSETRSVQAGSVVYVPPGGRQWLENTGDDELEFLCLVDPAWRIEDETILE